MESCAVKNVSFTLEDGSFVGLIGHTGSGKSTLFQHLNGLEIPTEGTVLFHGEDIFRPGYDLRALRGKVGLVFQYPEYQLFEETCFKDISFGPRNMGLQEEEIRERVQQAAKIVGLPEELLEKSPFDLSGGQKRRCAIAGVMAMRPEVLILDEPTAGLDPRGRDAVFGMICSYRQSTNAAVVIVTHSMEDAAEFADRILVMNHGRLVLDGSADEIFSHAEELVDMGLNVPSSTRLINDLRRMGYDLSGSVYTAQSAADEIASFIRRRGS